MGGPGAKRPKPKHDGVNWVYEEEAKTGKEYVCLLLVRVCVRC